MTRLRALLILLLLVGTDALARVGGGETFHTGGGGGGYSGGGHSGGGGGSGDGLALLIWLILEHPVIGIPVAIVILVVVINSKRQEGRFQTTYRTTTSDARTMSADRPAARARPSDPLDVIAAEDTGFSRPVLFDHLQLVHRRALEAAATGSWDALVPFVAKEARDQLSAEHPGITRIDQVVLAAIRVESASVASTKYRGDAAIDVRFTGSRVHHRADGTEQRVYVEDVWTLTRAAGARSLAPDVVRRMGCPSCGAAIVTDPLGKCRQCGVPIADGRLQWQVRAVRIAAGPRAITPPDVSHSPGGQEAGYRVGTVVNPAIAARMRELQGRHADFAWKDFEDRARAIFLALQQSWSDGKWEGARPYVTDTLFDTLLFWMDGYKRAGQRNKLTDVRVERLQVANVAIDAWYESITVRVWASMKDFVIDANGNVVGGNAKVDRSFSEYWTFIRAAGKGGAVKPVHACPSCGAALDRIGQNGVCGYCDTNITTGDFDWVLARIDQPEVYSG